MWLSLERPIVATCWIVKFPASWISSSANAWEVLRPGSSLSGPMWDGCLPIFVKYNTEKATPAQIRERRTLPAHTNSVRRSRPEGADLVFSLQLARDLEQRLE